MLIGLSLLVGLMVRVSASFGVLLMVVYWTAHMDFPYIENKNNFIVDYHIVYGFLLALSRLQARRSRVGARCLGGKIAVLRSSIHGYGRSSPDTTAKQARAVAAGRLRRRLRRRFSGYSRDPAENGQLRILPEEGA